MRNRQNQNNKFSNEELDSFFEDDFSPEQMQDPGESLSWKASEYVHHNKTTMWFAMGGLLAVVLAVAFWFILKDVTTVVLIIVMSVALFRFANRQPQTMEYTLDSRGLTIGGAEYDFSNFRSFSIMQDNGIFNIELDPLQRYRPSLSIFFAPEDGDKIIDILSNFLPLEEKDPDFIDKLLRKARF